MKKHQDQAQTRPLEELIEGCHFYKYLDIIKPLSDNLEGVCYSCLEKIERRFNQGEITSEEKNLLVDYIKSISSEECFRRANRTLACWKHTIFR